MTSATANFGSANCVALDKYSNSDFTSRYSGKFGTCKVNPGSGFITVDAAITSYSSALHSYQSDVNTQLPRLDSSMLTIKSSHDTLVSKVKSEGENMGKFKEDIQEFLDSITGPKGTLTKLNCKFIGENIHRIRKTLCWTFAPALFWFSFFLGFIGVLSCCAMPCLFYVNKNFKYASKDSKV